MEPNTAIALGSLLVAILAIILGALRSKKHDDQALQRTSDKLDHIGATVEGTRADVQKINATLTNHGETLARVDARLTDHDRRLDKLES